MFERFRMLTIEEIKNREWSWEDFTYSESNILIYETPLNRTDRAIANRLFLNGDTYERTASDLSLISSDLFEVTATSEKSIQIKRKKKIAPAIRETIIRLLPYWNDEFERNWIEISKLSIAYHNIKIESGYLGKTA